MDDISLGSYAPSNSESAPSDCEQQWNLDTESKGVEIDLEGVRVKFPFQPYQCQEDLMRHIIRALNGNRENALLESPTGTGKSMSLLCSVLAWLAHFRKRREKELREVPSIDVSSTKENDAGRVKGRQTENDDYGYFETSDPGDADPVQAPPAKRSKSEESKISMKVPKIFITSRTHKQISQLVKELDRCPYRPNFTVLGSRRQYCINPDISKDKDINEACRSACKTASCKYFETLGKQARKRKYTLVPNCDIEDFVKLGREEGFCPYYAARAAIDRADVVFAPYNYLIDPKVRNAISPDIKAYDPIVIIDEAHNIEDTCREAGSFEVEDELLEKIHDELSRIINILEKYFPKESLMLRAHTNQAHVVTVLLNWLKHVVSGRAQLRREFESSMHIWQDGGIIDELASLGINSTHLSVWHSDLDKISEKSKEVVGPAQLAEEVHAKQRRDDPTDKNPRYPPLLSTGSMQVLDGLYHILEKVLDAQYLPAYRMVKYQSSRMGPNGKTLVFCLGLWCLSPEVIFNDVKRLTKSIILTSGTLSPMESFSSELGTKFEQRLEAMHIIAPEQTWVGCISNGPSGSSFLGNYRTMDAFAYQDDLCEAILRVCSIVPAGVLCFLPSYAYLDKIIRRMQAIGIYDRVAKVKKMFLEPRTGTPKDFERLMKNYYKVIQETAGRGNAAPGLNGALLFAIYRGKISEGLDLRDDNCRAVIPVGIPYPAFKDPKVILKREYNDLQIVKKVLSGQHWYEIQAFRALNQALGRCIRHAKDWGAIVFLEQRFTLTRNSNQLSKWVRGRLQPYPSFELAMTSLANFIRTNFKVTSVEGRLKSIE